MYLIFTRLSVSCPTSTNLKYPLEVGYGKYPPDFGGAVDDAYISTISTGVLPKHQQHTESRAIDILGLSQVDHIALFFVPLLPERLPKLLVEGEIETFSDTNGNGFTVIGCLATKWHSRTALSRQVVTHNQLLCTLFVFKCNTILIRPDYYVDLKPNTGHSPIDPQLDHVWHFSAGSFRVIERVPILLRRAEGWFQRLNPPYTPVSYIDAARFSPKETFHPAISHHFGPDWRIE